MTAKVNTEINENKHPTKITHHMVVTNTLHGHNIIIKFYVGLPFVHVVRQEDATSFSSEC